MRDDDFIDVERLLSDRCGGCHNAAANTGELDLDSLGIADRVSARPSSGCEGFVLANPQNPTGSLLYLKVSGEGTGCGDVMPPPPLAALTEEEVLAVRDWIAGLAPPAAVDRCKPREERLCEEAGNEDWWPDLMTSGQELEAQQAKICRPPVQKCLADGSGWGPCEGVFPSVEDCRTPEDEDCNFSTPANECRDVAWAFSVSGERSQWFDSVAGDSEGNVYVLGTFEGKVDFGGGVLVTDVPDGQYKNDVVLAKYDRYGNHLWSKDFGDTSNQYATRIAVDAENGDVAMLMRLFGSVDFGPGSPTHEQQGNSDFVVALFDADGRHRWSQLFGGGALDRAERIAFSRDNGDVVVSGKAGVDLEDRFVVPGQGPIAMQGQADGIVVRLGRSVGDVKWYHRAGGRDLVVGDERVADVGKRCEPEDGQVYRRCRGCGAQHCVPDADDPSRGSWSKSCDVLRDSDGLQRFPCERTDLICSEEADSLAQCRSGDDDYAYGVTTDLAGDVYVTGRFEGYFDFEALDGAAGKTERTSLGQHDIFVAKLSGATGRPIWSRHFGGAGDDRAYDIAWQPSTGFLLVAGYFTGSLDFVEDGEEPGLQLRAYGGVDDDDVLLFALDPETGAVMFARNYGDEVSQFGVSHELGKTTRSISLELDTDDNIYLGGYLYGSWDNRITANSGSEPKPDLFYVKLSPEGEYLNGRVHGSTGSELAYDMALDPVTSSVLLVGRFYSRRLDLGAAGTVLGISNISSGFVAKWPQP